MDEDKQTTEVRETNTQSGDTVTHRQTVEKSTQTSGLVIFQRIIWFIAGFIIVFLVARLMLLLIAGTESSPFVNFVYAVSGLFAAPFYGMFSYTPSLGKSYFEISTAVAVVVYFVVAWGITKLVTLTRPNEEI